MIQRILSWFGLAPQLPVSKPEVSRVQKYLDCFLVEDVDAMDRLWFSMSREEHDAVRVELGKKFPSRPYAIVFFFNAGVSVSDQWCRRLDEYVGLTHAQAIVKLSESGVDWRSLQRLGEPQLKDSKDGDHSEAAAGS